MYAGATASVQHTSGSQTYTLQWKLTSQNAHQKDPIQNIAYHVRKSAEYISSRWIIWNTDRMSYSWLEMIKKTGTNKDTCDTSSQPAIICLNEGCGCVMQTCRQPCIEFSCPTATGTHWRNITSLFLSHASYQIGPNWLLQTHPCSPKSCAVWPKLSN
jgi:hypothetical protein